MIKLHFNGYSCYKELSLKFNCSIARATVMLVKDLQVIFIIALYLVSCENEQQ
jgi:hypothetical protein